MMLDKDHMIELLCIGLRGYATFLCVILFWSSTAPTIFYHQNLFLFATYSGLCCTVVLIGCFYSSYNNLLTPNLSSDDRKRGFIFFWFSGTIFFNIIWQMPYWMISYISKAPAHSTLFHGTSIDVPVYWKIYWWSYTLHDAWYDTLSPLVIAFEIWWMFANCFGCVALYKMIKMTTTRTTSTRTTATRRSDMSTSTSTTALPPSTSNSIEKRTIGSNQDTEHMEEQQQNTQERYDLESSILFLVCGTLQSYNSTLYVCLSILFGNTTRGPYPSLSSIIFFSLHCFRVCATITATYFSYQMLRVAIQNMNAKSIQQQIQLQLQHQQQRIVEQDPQKDHDETYRGADESSTEALMSGLEVVEIYYKLKQD